jgi:parallel beta-helix repeat protein
MMNPDMMNPDVLSAEVYTPDMMNPDMMNPDMMNPDMMNPDMMNPDMMNPDMMNPDMMNPDMMNITPSGDVNATMLNPDMMNPDMMNADLTNAALTDTAWTLTNNGNTTAAYDVKLLLRGSSQVPDGFKTQLLLYRTYLTPVARDCELTEETQNVLIASVPNPPFGHVGDTVLFSPTDGTLGHTTLWLAPGESAKITLRVLDPDRHDLVIFDPVSEVTPAVAPQPVDTISAAGGKTTPDVVTTSPIVFRTRPVATPIGGYVTPPVEVLVEDDSGSPIAGATVTLSLASNPGGATLHGGTATTGSDGVATFSTLWLDRLGNGYRLQATAGTRTSNDSGSFNIVPLVVTTTADAGPGSLRQAIENANRNAGYTDAISFNVPGGGTQTIALTSALPAIADALTIDGTTQPGYAGVPLVRLDGVGAGPSASGLVAQGTSVTIRGVAITRFSGDGVRLETATGGLVEDSYIGTDGMADLGNGGDGLVIQSGSGNVVRGCTVSGNGRAGVLLWGTQDDDVVGNKIGTNAGGNAAIPNDSSGIVLRVSSRQRIGTGAPGSGNVISGNAVYGIGLFGPGAVSDVLIAGNRIGTNAAGTAALPNGLGVYVFETTGSGITIGGPTPDARNLISGNSSHGIYLDTTRQVAVAGNYVGTDASGAAGLGNGHSGITIGSAQDNRIGGTAAAEGNTIAFNGGAGIGAGGSGSGNAFLGNRMFSNGGLGIDLAPPGPNPNDVGDGDTGPNDLLNYPVLASAVDSGTQTTVSGSVDIGVPGATVTIQFFHNAACDPSGYGEGQTLVGQTTIATGGDGTATFVAGLPGGLGPGYITATTVLSPTNTTSEFSACRSVTTGGTLGFLVQPTASPIGGYVAPPVKVLVQDGSGAAVPSAAVTLSFASNPGGATLNGGTATTDSSGIATFSELWLDRLGSGFRLRATVATYPVEDSATFDVTPLVITSIADAGAGSLRAAIENANRNAGYADAISFDIPGAGPHTIAPAAELPLITDPVVIDGTTQPGFAGAPLIELSGLSAGPARGLVIGAGGSTVRGLAIGGFQGEGIWLTGASGNVLQGNFIGTDASGTVARANQDGILVTASSGNLIGGTSAADRNVISGNLSMGVKIDTALSIGNQVVGNFIGTDATGALALGNGQSGVLIADAPGNTVGGTASGAGNVISGNNASGILIQLAGATGNQILGNRIGTTASGMAAVGNGLSGISVFSASNTIGGTTNAARNVISGNGVVGVWLVGASATGNQVQGNFVGTDATGSAVVGNGGIGIYVGGPGNTVGGTSVGSGNVISGNLRGVGLVGADAAGNVVQGNRIGTDSLGMTTLGNTAQGVFISSDAHGNTVGASSSAARNIISGNSGFGVEFSSTAGTGNEILGNYIGVAADGSTPRANAAGGVRADVGPNRIGDLAPGAGNVISGNGGRGVWLPSGDDHVVQGNLIGTNSQGDAAVPNATTGITIEGATARHTLRGNVVSGNVGAGVEILGGAHDIIVVDNKIGTNLAGAAALGNGSDGVRLSSGAHDNSIGSHTAGFGNLISGNGVTGVTLAGTSANTVLGNRIGTDASGTAAIPNQGFGVSLAQSSSDTIGGEAAGAGNLISGNGGGGVAVGPMTGGAVVSGNRIGTNADGTSAIGNAGEGVFVTGPDTSVVMIKANVVSGNSRTGIDIVNGAHHNSVVANRVGTNLSGSAAMPNGSTSSGVRVSGDAHSNTIGGAGAGEGNLISGNYIGITLATTHDNTVQGNRIGTNGDGMSAIPNTVSGIFLDSTAGGAIGGTGAGQGNLVSGNGECGISVWFGGVTGALIAGNRIGTNADGTAAVGNTLTGICMRGTATSDNTVSGNLLSGNGRHGLEILSGPHDNTIVLNKIGTNVTGTGPLGNAQAGVILSNPGANVIGALTPALGNTIAFNGTSGIAYFEGTAPNVFGANRIHSNGWLGIGFAGDAVTANDPQDTDTGPNDLLNFPVLTSAVGSTTGTTVEGTLSSIPGATFAIQVFSNASCDPSGYGEGEVFEGMTTVTTDSPGGNGSFTVTLPGDLTGRFVTATTSTSLTTGGMTSEFSACRSVTSGGTLVFSAQPTTAPIGGYVTPPVQVLVRDETSAPVPGVTVTLSLASNPAGATLHGGTATSDSSGIATLSELWLDRLGGGFSLRATVGTYPPEDSATFDVTPLLVTTIADVGPGSLRAAIENANRNAGYADTISFGIGAGPVVISPASALPALTDPVTLDATSQPGYAGWPIVRLDGSGAGGGSGFTVQASGVTIRGFAITGFTGSGVVLRYATGAVVADNYVGTDGTTALANLSHGISIEYGSANELRDNVVSGNQNEGINLFSTSANSIRGNRIGTNAAGTAALPNTPRGIFAGGGSTDNVIGGPSPTDRNVISGNSQYGVVMGVGAAHNRIEGNYVGTNAAGTAAIANTIGVELDDQDNVVRGNLLSGNGGYGIAFVNAPNTLLENNLIGTSADGAAPIPNSLGVLVFAAPGSLMRNNVVSGNSPGQGMWLQPANHLTIVGNKIGTRADGAVALPNAGVGIMAYGCVSSTIGGAAPGDGNLVSGNLQQGIVLQPDANGLVGCVVEGNLVGTNLAGSAALPNGGTGIEVTAVSAPAAPMSGIAIRGNLLSGNGGVGLILDGAHQVIASANRIGTNAAGDAAIPNEGVGIALSAGAGGNTIGGALPGEGNVISGNGSVGVDIANSSGNQFWGNWIGTNDARTHLGNGGSGVTISGTSTTNSIGGPYTGMGNAIAFNTGNGVQDTGGPTGNQILGNSIFSNGLLGILDNGMLDPPALTSADTSGGTTTVSGALHEPDYPGVFWIEFFRSPNCDASGSGEGEQLMGHAEVTTDGAGNGIFSVALPAISGGVVTATATSSIGTSGFSACLVPDLALVVGDLREVASAEAAYQSAAGGWYGTLNCLLTPTDCIVDYPPAGPVFISADLASLATRAGYVRAFSPGPEVSSFLLLVPGLEEFAYTAVPENGFGPGFCIDNSGAIYTNADGTATAVNGRCTSGTPLP